MPQWNMPMSRAGRATLSVVVADNVRIVCARRRITQTELARVLGMSKMAVSDRFRYITPWTVDDLGVLSEFLAVPVGVLLGEVVSTDGETTGSAPLLPKPGTGRAPGPGPIGPQLPLESLAAAADGKVWARPA